MSLMDLIERAPAPSAPTAAGSAEEWARIEHILGLTLPPDYKELVTTYGAGRFANFVTVFTPFTRNPYINLLGQRGISLDAYRRVRHERRHRAPYPAYPEPGGVLAWAQTDNGDVLYWLTQGSAQDWPTIVAESRHSDFERYDLNATDFLVRLLNGELPTRILPRDLSEDAGFAPLSPQLA